jgi:hypothetical protein
MPKRVERIAYVGREALYEPLLPEPTEDTLARVILGNAFAMKRWIAITILLLVPALASAEPITTGNYLRYSYRDHYRAYGINSLTDGTLPADEYYYDPCYRWVSTTRGLKRKLVCR